MSKFCKWKGLLIGTYASTLETAKAYLSLPNTYISVGSPKSSFHIQYTLPDLEEVYRKLALSS